MCFCMSEIQERMAIDIDSNAKSCSFGSAGSSMDDAHTVCSMAIMRRIKANSAPGDRNDCTLLRLELCKPWRMACAAALIEPLN